MDINQQKEQFSSAYVRAVVSVAGYALYKPEVDDDSVDWGIAARGGKGTYRSPRVELQLKCIARDVMRDQIVRFPLEVKNYEELRHADYQVPRILVLVLVPDRIEKWLEQSEDALAMRHCGYWISLRGAAATENTETVTVEIPRTRQFTVEAVRLLMDRVGQEGLP